MHLWRRLGIIQVNLASALALHKRSCFAGAKLRTILKTANYFIRKIEIRRAISRVSYVARIKNPCHAPVIYLGGRLKPPRRYRSTLRCVPSPEGAGTRASNPLSPVYANFQPPMCTTPMSPPMPTGSYPVFSPLPLRCPERQRGAVIFFCTDLPSRTTSR